MNNPNNQQQQGSRTAPMTAGNDGRSPKHQSNRYANNNTNREESSFKTPRLVNNNNTTTGTPPPSP